LLVQITIAVLAIFGLAVGWVLVDKLHRRIMTTGPNACELPEHECGHCMQGGACHVRQQRDGAA
jgi:hypothetical protein